MKTTFIAAATVCAGMFASCAPGGEQHPSPAPYSTPTDEREPPLSPAAQQRYAAAARERASVLAQLKAKAARDWPNDQPTQEFWVNEELAAYDHLLTVPDDAVKRAAQREWPLDFTTQKYWYYQQQAANEGPE